jgi:hypothetical protein
VLEHPKTTSRSVTLSAPEDAALARLARDSGRSISSIVRAALQPLLMKAQSTERAPAAARKERSP